jgi:hypothetical protein
VSRRSKVSTTPMALASDGTLYVNVALTDESRDPKKLVERAVARRPARPRPFLTRVYEGGARRNSNLAVSVCEH